LSCVAKFYCNLYIYNATYNDTYYTIFKPQWKHWGINKFSTICVNNNTKKCYFSFQILSIFDMDPFLNNLPQIITNLITNAKQSIKSEHVKSKIHKKDGVLTDTLSIKMLFPGLDRWNTYCLNLDILLDVNADRDNIVECVFLWVLQNIAF
jgi:hypothetical protein